ncbi:ABC transporter ATP-binding protein [Methanofollis fontis]|uniref:ABC transporter ATP-binding protein n=1 Tax=Methanofollis fontis TaxID=2052832 RepID=A0A483CZN2_9EURY|nr:ABC transporter ATP-binding protein [Methanofollis fontis]
MISIEHLQKGFKGREVLRAVTFSVKKGEVFGFLGPNGAGKTTTMRCLLGLLRPDGGTATVFGEDLARSDGLRRKVGVLLENDGLSDRLTARDNLDYHARLYGVQERERRIEEILEFIGLSDRQNSLVGTYSTGMRRKLGIGRSILHTPEVLFLDEPTSGLDPEAQRMVRDLILELSREEEMTVFINSHNLDEVQRVCSSVGILHDGRLRAFDRIERLREDGGGRVRIVLTDPPSAEEALRTLTAMPGIGPADRDGEEVTVHLEGTGVPAIVRTLVEKGCAIEEVVQERRSLEEIYLSVVRQAEGSA